MKIQQVITFESKMSLGGKIVHQFCLHIVVKFSLSSIDGKWSDRRASNALFQLDPVKSNQVQSCSIVAFEKNQNGYLHSEVSCILNKNHKKSGQMRGTGSNFTILGRLRSFGVSKITKYLPCFTPFLRNSTIFFQNQIGLAN